MLVEPDALQTMKKRCEAILRTMKEWEEISCSTDFEGQKQGFWAQAREA